MTHSKDYRRELGHELRRLQGALAVDLRLRMGAAAGDDRAWPATSIATASPPATSNDLPWPTCVSSLVWFIGTGEP